MQVRSSAWPVSQHQTRPEGQPQTPKPRPRPGFSSPSHICSICAGSPFLKRSNAWPVSQHWRVPPHPPSQPWGRGLSWTALQVQAADPAPATKGKLLFIIPPLQIQVSVKCSDGPASTVITLPPLRSETCSAVGSNSPASTGSRLSSSDEGLAWDRSSIHEYQDISSGPASASSRPSSSNGGQGCSRSAAVQV